MKKRITFVLLVIILLLPKISLANGFSDVEYDHWAKFYIEKLTNENILHGYPDGSFKPNNHVSFLETLSIIKGIKNPDPKILKKSVKLYGPVANKYKIEDWAIEAFCYALYENILYESDLKKYGENFLVSDLSLIQYPNRKYIAELFARTLEVAPVFDHSNLKYKDFSELGKASATDLDLADYLSALVKIEIFDPEGSEGKFEPLRAFRRAELAKITYLSNSYLKNH